MYLRLFHTLIGTLVVVTARPELSTMMYMWRDIGDFLDFATPLAHIIYINGARNFFQSDIDLPHPAHETASRRSASYTCWDEETYFDQRLPGTNGNFTTPDTSPACDCQGFALARRVWQRRGHGRGCRGGFLLRRQGAVFFVCHGEIAGVRVVNNVEACSSYEQREGEKRE